MPRGVTLGKARAGAGGFPICGPKKYYSLKAHSEWDSHNKDTLLRQHAVPCRKMLQTCAPMVLKVLPTQLCRANRSNLSLCRGQNDRLTHNLIHFRFRFEFFYMNFVVHVAKNGDLAQPSTISGQMAKRRSSCFGAWNGAHHAIEAVGGRRASRAAHVSRRSKQPNSPRQILPCPNKTIKFV